MSPPEPPRNRYAAPDALFFPTVSPGTPTARSPYPSPSASPAASDVPNASSFSEAPAIPAVDWLKERLRDPGPDEAPYQRVTEPRPPLAYGLPTAMSP